MQLRYFGLVLCAAGVIAGCGAKNSEGGPTDSRSRVLLQRQILGIATQANQAAPAAIDPDTRLDGAQAGPGLRLTTRYTLVNTEANGISAANFDTKLAPVVRKSSCTNPELRPLIDAGAIVVLEYRALDGSAIGTVTLDRAACLKPG